MKKRFLTTIILSMILVLSSVLTAFAASSPEAVQKRPVSAIDEDGKERKDEITITVPNKDDLTDEIIDEIFKDDKTGTPITSVEIDTIDGTKIHITIDVPGIKSGDDVYVVVYDKVTKKYKKLTAVAGDNVVSFDITDDGIVIVVKNEKVGEESTEEETTTGNGEGGGEANPLGDVAPIAALAVLAVSSLAVAIVLGVKAKKEN